MKQCNKRQRTQRGRPRDKGQEADQETKEQKKGGA